MRNNIVKKVAILVWGICLASILCLAVEQYNFANRDSNAINKQQPYQKQLVYQMNTDTKEKNSLSLSARAAALIDASSGRVLYEKNMNEELPMASTTKIMTCIIVLENADLDDIVTFSDNAARQPDVQMNAKAGEQYRVEDLLYALMLESYNDVAVALAEHVGGSVENFAAMMNQKAADLGCIHTHFVTPNGLDATQHYTTAKELCNIAAYAIQNSDFIKITNTMSHQFEECHAKRQVVVNNKDRFLSMYTGAIGVKTGFTSKAGYCFVGAVEHDNKQLVSAVLGSGWPPNKNFKWQDTIKLMDYGEKKCEETIFFQQPLELPKISICGGKENYVDLVYEPYCLSTLSDGTESLKVVAIYQGKRKAPIKASARIGWLRYYINDEMVKEVPIYTKKAVLEKNQSKLKWIWAQFSL